MNSVLIIDDDKELCALMKKCVEQENLSAVVAHGGLEGLRLLEKNKDTCSLIILDVMMPDMNGFQVLQKIREKNNVPVLMLTAKSDEEDKVSGLRLGADDYLTKPFGVMEFVSRIRALLRRFSSKKKQISVIGNRQKIELNKDAREVFVKGEKCPLTYKEFELLQVLMSHADQVMTRDSLMELIWGVDFFGESRTLDMHIRTLRKKLGEAGSQIQTIRNVGYCFRKTEDETE